MSTWNELLWPCVQQICICLTRVDTSVWTSAVDHGDHRQLWVQHPWHAGSWRLCYGLQRTLQTGMFFTLHLFKVHLNVVLRLHKSGGQNRTEELWLIVIIVQQSLVGGLLGFLALFSLARNCNSFAIVWSDCCWLLWCVAESKFRVDIDIWSLIAANQITAILPLH